MKCWFSSGLFVDVKPRCRWFVSSKIVNRLASLPLYPLPELASQLSPIHGKMVVLIHNGPASGCVHKPNALKL